MPTSATPDPAACLTALARFADKLPALPFFGPFGDLDDDDDGGDDDLGDLSDLGAFGAFDDFMDFGPLVSLGDFADFELVFMVPWTGAGNWAPPVSLSQPEPEVMPSSATSSPVWRACRAASRCLPVYAAFTNATTSIRRANVSRSRRQQATASRDH